MYDTALCRILEVLCDASRTIQTSPSVGIDDSEFSECLSEALAALGSQNLQCFIGFQNHLTIYLQQVILVYLVSFVLDTLNELRFFKLVH